MPFVGKCWLVAYTLFLGFDFFCMLLKHKQFPTFSRTLTSALPAWVLLPATFILLIHFAEIYWRRK